MDTTYIDNAAQAHLDAFDALAPGAACAGKAYFISNGEPMAGARDRQRPAARRAARREVHRQPAVSAWPMPPAPCCEVVWRVLRLNGEPPMTRFLAEQLSTPHWYDIGAGAARFRLRARGSAMAEGLALRARPFLKELGTVSDTATPLPAGSPSGPTDEHHAPTPISSWPHCGGSRHRRAS